MVTLHFRIDCKYKNSSLSFLFHNNTNTVAFNDFELYGERYKVGKLNNEQEIYSNILEYAFGNRTDNCNYQI